MPDMLVKLYEIGNDRDFLDRQSSLGITLRKPIGPENTRVIEWVQNTFGESWASETGVALSNRPVSCFIAIRDQAIIGFACYDATALGFFGPSGVAETQRGQGTGRALLLSCLLDMKMKGYGYAIIGGVGPMEFYAKVAGAVEIPGSSPGIYQTLLPPVGLSRHNPQLA